jgi:putative acetyltransferase
MKHPAFALYRWAKPQEFDRLGQIMFDAIHDVPSPYTAAQQTAWAPTPPEGPRWHAALNAQSVAICADTTNTAQGFVTLTSDGLVDFAFIAPNWRGTGRFRPLMAMIIARARGFGLATLTTYASLSAQSSFRNLGFSVEHHETVDRQGEYLKRARMTRIL